MPTLTTVLVLIVTTILICIVPGPDMLYIISRSTGQGRPAGVVSCIGVACGGLFQTSAVALGISGLFLAVPVAYELLKYVGALYLIYLGIRTILNRKEVLSSPQTENAHHVQAFFQGAFTTLLNPKVALFYLAFLPQFVRASQGNVSLQLLILGLLFNITSLTIDTSVALLASFLSSWLKRHLRAEKLVAWMTGSTLIGLGVRLAFSQKN